MVDGERRTVSDSRAPAYDSRRVANEFIRAAAQEGRGLSIMTLLKFVYIAHGWTLALLDRPLITDLAEAWRYGPVVPSVYFGFRPQGVYNLRPANLIESDLDEDAESMTIQTYKRYGNLTPFQLSGITHVKGGPWDRIIKTKGHGAEIPNDVIRDHYVGKLERWKNLNGK